MRSKFEVLG